MIVSTPAVSIMTNGTDIQTASWHLLSSGETIQRTGEELVENKY
jgi:hypothetical protein